MSLVALTNTLAAWWIAFGPHGPRASEPPGEWTRVWLYTAAGVAISCAVFAAIHAFAKPPPRSMTKEWQEATNEYLKVSQHLRSSTQKQWHPLLDDSELTYPVNSPKRAILCTVSAARDTQVQDMFRASRPRPRASAWMLNRPSMGSSGSAIWLRSGSYVSPLYCALLSREGRVFLYFVNTKIKRALQFYFQAHSVCHCT
jgi:hypothetical protein